MRAPGQTVERALPGDIREQIKTRERVRDLAEVYTHRREVDAMLDLVPDMFPGTVAEVAFKFLEPACGSGNFLVEVLRRKLEPIQFSLMPDPEQYEHWLLRAMASVYGVDICAENVVETKRRLLDTLHWHYFNDTGACDTTPSFARGVKAVLDTNILHADMLAQAPTTEVVEYLPGQNGTFTREWSLLDGSAALAHSPSLFDQVDEPKRDAVPIHYSCLSDYPAPTQPGDRAASRAKVA